MAQYSQPLMMRKHKGGKSSRAQRASLPAHIGNNVIVAIQEAVATATLSKGTEVGLARLKYLQEYIWSKYSDPLPGEEFVDATVRAQRAIEKWQAAEYRNAKTNCRLQSSHPITFTTKRVNGHRTRTFTSSEVLSIARGIVKSVLGVRPPHESVIQGMFTNGASTRVKRSETSVAEKFEGRPHATAQAALFYSGEAFANPGWGRLNPDGFTSVTVEGSVLFTVPKNSRIDRVACKEPEVNSYLQRAYGIFIRTRLKKHGIDLLDQTRNQYLSRIAVSRGLATVDLSSASDTISRELVKQLVPDEWFTTLDSLRSHSVAVPSSAFRHNLEMFSSMGNGFTFELESLIFWALTRALSRLLGVKGTISVYGDDIICPSSTAKLLVRVFSYFGFTVNRSKSCISGGYRESCGAHWYFGHDVKPFFVRERPRTMPDLIRIGNQLLAWMAAEENSDDIPSSVLGLWGYLATLIPQTLYGGQSYDRSDALVTGHAPRRLLRQKLERVETPQLGAYLCWHHSKLLSPSYGGGNPTNSPNDLSSGTLRAVNLAASERKKSATVGRHCFRRSPLMEGRLREAIARALDDETPVSSPSESYREVGWVSRPNRSWYDRDTMWSAQQTILVGLSRVNVK